MGSLGRGSLAVLGWAAEEKGDDDDDDVDGVSVVGMGPRERPRGTSRGLGVTSGHCSCSKQAVRRLMGLALSLRGVTVEDLVCMQVSRCVVHDVCYYARNVWSKKGR